MKLWPRHLLAALASGLVFVLAAAAPAAAQPKEGEKEKKEEQVQVFKRKKAEPVSVGQSGPKLRGEDIVRVFQAQAQAKRDEAIRTLEEIIRSTPADDPQKPDYLFRLSEQYWDKAHFFNLRAYGADDEIWATEKTDPARHEQLKRLKQEDLNRETQYREKTISIYKDIIRGYPTYEKLDHVMYYLGFNYKEKGDSESAQKIFTMLIKKYPGSVFIPDTLLAFGEFFFEINEIDNAARFYEKAAKYKDSKVYGYAVYKLGWCHYNQKMFEKAMERFIEVIQYSESQVASGDANRINLMKEAQNDLVRSYSQVGTGQKAIAFFKKVVPSNYIGLSRRLAEIYAGDGKNDQSSDLYRQLIKLNMESPDVVEYQLAIVTNVEKGGDKDATVLEIKRLVKLFQVFLQKKTLPEEKARSLGDSIQDLLHELATSWHHEAQVTKNDVYLDYAYEMYKAYVETFPQAKDIYEMTFYFAELLYHHRKQWEDAAHYYEKVIEINPQGKYARDAAHATVLAYQKLLNLGERREVRAEPVGKQEAGVGKIPPAREISGAQKRFIEACDRYARMVPDGDRIVDVKYFVALTYYDHNHFDEAIRRFMGIIDEHSNHRLALFCANLVLDAYNLKQDYEGLNRSVDKFLANKSIAQGEFLETLMTLREGASFKACIQMEEQKRHREAAEGFVKFINEFPTSQFYDKALYNAALNYERVNDISKAIGARFKLMKQRPGSELVPKAMFAIAGNFHATAVYSQAAQYYEAYAATYPETPEAKDSLANAAAFRQGLGEDDKAIANYRKWLEKYGKKEPRKASSVIMTIARIYQERKQYPQALKEMKDFLATWARHASDDDIVLVQTRMGLIYKELGQTKNASKAFEQAVKTFNGFPLARQKKLEDGREAAAQARYEQGETLYAEFVALPINSAKQLTEQTTAKMKAMAKAQEVYITVIDYGHPNWTIAATGRIGQGWQDLADSIRSSPAPKELKDEEEIEVYRDELDQKAIQFEELAIKSYARCLELAAEYKWFNEFTVRAERALGKLDPQKFQPINEIRTAPGHFGQAFSSAGFDSEVQ